jgi:hypothetical protein
VKSKKLAKGEYGTAECSGFKRSNISTIPIGEKMRKEMVL